MGGERSARPNHTKGGPRAQPNDTRGWAQGPLLPVFSELLELCWGGGGGVGGRPTVPKYPTTFFPRYTSLEIF
jgi:hypothetical protein